VGQNTCSGSNAAEEKQRQRCDQAMPDFGIRRRKTFRRAAFQKFRPTSREHFARAATAFERILHFAEAKDIVIPMICQLALL
jgi:hypothetical protein